MPPAPDLKLFVLQIAAVLSVARVAGSAFRRIGQPQVMGEMVAGILLGPSLLGRIFPEAFGYLFPAGCLGPLYVLSQVGLLLFMFLVGLQMRLKLLREETSSVMVASYASILAPFALGSLLALLLYPSFSGPDVPLPAFVLFTGAAMSITAFPVLARILQERNLMATRVGTLAISCAAVNDLSAWCLLALIMVVTGAETGRSPLLLRFAGLAAYVVVMIVAVRRLLRRVAWSHNGKLAAGGFAFALVLLFASSWATESLGVHALFGAFFVGVVMPRDGEWERALMVRLEPVALVFLLPLFFALTGLRTSIGLVSGARQWIYCALIIVVAVAGKLIGCALTMRATGMRWREAFAVGILVNTRGLVELVILNVGLDLKIISPTLFSMMVLMTLVTTFMTAPLLNLTHLCEAVASVASSRHATHRRPIFAAADVPQQQMAETGSGAPPRRPLHETRTSLR